MTKISPEIRLKIINLSKCFWFWSSFYNFYAQVLGISKRKIELKFPKDIYNKYSATEIILDELKTQGNIEKIKEIVSSFYRLREPFDKDKNPRFDEAKQELKCFRDLLGDDFLEEELKNREFKRKIEERKNRDLLERERINKINEIKNTFFEYTKETEQSKKQERGFWLEKVFYEILELEQIEHRKSYKTETEQIDGHFKFNKFDYLVEIKWTDNPVAQNDVSIFEGKLLNKGQSTRGFILSMSGFTDSAIKRATTTPPKIIFMDATEFISILENHYSFYDLFMTKEDNFVRLGKVYK